MDNPNPSPATRFKPGREKTAGRKAGTPNRMTVLSRAPKIRSLDEVMADPQSFRGSMGDLLESVARDSEQSIDIRLSCANAVARMDRPSNRSDDITTWTTPELRAELDRLHVLEMKIMTPEELDEHEAKTLAQIAEARAYHKEIGNDPYHAKRAGAIAEKCRRLHQLDRTGQQRRIAATTVNQPGLTAAGPWPTKKNIAAAE